MIRLLRDTFPDPERRDTVDWSPRAAARRFRRGVAMLAISSMLGVPCGVGVVTAESRLEADSIEFKAWFNPTEDELRGYFNCRLGSAMLSPAMNKPSVTLDLFFTERPPDDEREIGSRAFLWIIKSKRSIEDSWPEITVNGTPKTPIATGEHDVTLVPSGVTASTRVEANWVVKGNVTNTVGTTKFVQPWEVSVPCGAIELNTSNMPN